MGADGAGDEGQGVFLADEAQGGVIPALAAQLDILRDVLLDGAAALAGGGEAVHQGHLLVELPPGQGFHGLDVVLVGPGRQGQGLDARHVHAGKGLELHGVQLVADLDEALVAAGLQFGGGHGDGPDAQGKQPVDVQRVGAAGVADPHLPAELPGDPGGHSGGQGEEGLARHVHLLAGELPGLHVHGEGVGEFQAEFHAGLIRQGLEAAEHGDGVPVLEVLLEVVVVEGDVVVAHAVQDGPGGLIAQDGGVALDEGVEALLLNQVAGNALNLVRRAAVEGGEGDAAGDPGRDGVDKGRLAGEELLEHPDALLENGGLGGVHHAVQEGVDFLLLNARQIVAHGHIEHKGVGVAQPKDFGHDLTGAPGLDVLLKGLLDVQLRGPLAVVALVLRQNAGPVDAGRQVCAVHLLDGFQLEKPCAGEVAGNDVLGQLGVGSGGGAKGGLNLLTEDGQGLDAGPVGLVDAEDGALPLVLGGHPGHQFPEGNRGHQFGHSFFLLKISGWFSTVPAGPGVAAIE